MIQQRQVELCESWPYIRGNKLINASSYLQDYALGKRLVPISSICQPAPNEINKFRISS